MLGKPFSECQSSTDVRWHLSQMGEQRWSACVSVEGGVPEGAASFLAFPKHCSPSLPPRLSLRDRPWELLVWDPGPLCPRAWLSA